MILHVDMDAYYASVEERDDPSLIGKAVVVGGSASGRGVVCAANYESRKFGVHSAMAAVRAKQLCPHAVFIKPRMAHYAAISRQIRAIFECFTPLVEPLSLDEAFLDVTPCEALFGSAEGIARQIKQRIRSELQLVASVGVAPNKFLAKIASDIDKPDGLRVVAADGVQAFLDPLPVGRLWGVGKVTGQTFERLRIRTIGELRRLPLKTLQQLFGNSGDHYWRLAHGNDDRIVVPDRQAKSISHETTFDEDIADFEVLQAWLMELAEQVARRLRRHELKGRTVELKIRFHDFRTIMRSASLAEPSNITTELFAAGAELLRTKLPFPCPAVRLLGFGVKGFDDSGVSQRQLFDEPMRDRERELDKVADQIANRFGKSAIQRALRHAKPDDE